MAPRIPRGALTLARPLLDLPSRRLLPRALSTTAPSLAVVASSRSALPADYVPATQPPSARRPEKREAQLIRSYTSLLRSTPLMLFFQHNNLTAVEWIAVRRELNAALSRVGPVSIPGVEGKLDGEDLSGQIKLEVLRVKMFDVALKITEFFDAEAARADPNTQRTKRHGPLVHDLSLAAYEASSKGDQAAAKAEGSTYAQLSPLFSGPLAALVFPALSPAHLAAALTVLAPSPGGAFAAPSRKKFPGYYDPVVQGALSKLLLIGGRVEGKVFDGDGVRWVGGIEGGLDGLRASLVGMLQGVGMGLTGALESAPKNVWFALEGRRMQLEDESKGETKEEAKE
ncbi:related to ribosomal protein YmL11 precursor, mitochondrial [Cephalotrichum gorgonifer]|uniref:Related to ribosomal protein YmL11, mitochondrial n=1 Tax=Cephalotrichum gorgonifer TaxID=2041049 RepID=A0AAE8N0I5_9PEZI|nr:related to ribosomal protein YmL11 precursor, mitochondrial [Cephalotrichum gorgonifer]